MNKIITLFAILNCLVKVTLAQSSYFMTFHSDKNEKPFDVIEDSNHDILAVGIRDIDDSQEDSYNGMIWKIAANGDTLSRVYSFGDTSIYFNYIEQRGESYYIIGTSFIPPLFEDSKLEVLQLDSDLNVLSKRTIVDRNSYMMIDNKIRKLGDNYYLLGMEETDSCNYDIVIKLSEDFSLNNFYRIWEKRCKLMDCLLSPDSNQFWLFTAGYNEEFGPELSVFDTSMNFIQLKNFPYKLWPGTGDLETGYLRNLTVKWYTDTTFLVICNHEQTYNNGDILVQELGASVMDSSLSLVPVHYFSNPDTIDYAGFMTNQDFITTDEIFFCGNKNVIAMFYPPFPSWIIAGKLNNQLESEYVNYFGGDAYYRTHSIKATSDGGSIIIGKRYDHLTQNYEWDVTFLKLNSEGLITDTKYLPCHITDKAWIYPNPADSYLNIESTYSSGEVRIYT
ncbi:MAG: hypothetical protein WCQ70_11345, partial [Lentimicrobiaceae bacterium]